MLSRDQAYNSETRAIPVLITYDDGTEVQGSLNIPKLAELSEILSNAVPFLMFSYFDGRTVFVASSKIRSVQVINCQKIKPLTTIEGNFDPYQILGVSPSDDAPTIRKAFHRLTKLYHPDKFAAHESPDEIMNYIKAMSQRINLAYAAIEENLSASEPLA